MRPIRRRRFLKQSAALVAAPALVPGPAFAVATDPASDMGMRRIAFGSCAHQDKEQPIWDVIGALDPDLVILLGDNVYGDTRDPEELRAAYLALAEKPGFRRLRERVPMIATWDDHDYGENDAGAEFPIKEASRRIFCDFWNEPADSPRRTRDGIYAAYLFGPPGRRLQVLLPDLRFNRTPLLLHDLGGGSYDDWAAGLEQAGKPVPGPYARNPARNATLLGSRQWQWLEEQLQTPADLRIFASSLPVAADFSGWETWLNFPRDRDRLIDAIRHHHADGLICISGDTHWAELSRIDGNVPYPLWDLTSSGLTETWPVLAPNANRVGGAWREQNFGLIDILWQDGHADLLLRIFDAAGAPRIEHRLRTLDLRTPDR